MQNRRGDNIRHDAVRDALAEWMREDLTMKVMTEQEIPKWHKPGNAKDAKARLDVCYTDKRLGEVCVDVSIVAASANLSPKQSLAALARRERGKHVRYSGPGLFAFVLDAIVIRNS